MIDTDLVEALTSVGVSERRAAAFERCLDDRPFCGISGILLGKFIKLYGAKQAYLATSALTLAAQQAELQKNANVELFQRGAYGTYTAHGATSGPK